MTIARKYPSASAIIQSNTIDADASKQWQLKEYNKYNDK